MADPIVAGDKVFPLLEGLTVETVGDHGWNVVAGDLLLPAMVLRESALSHNLHVMAGWCEEQGVSLAPHGKTTMAPQLFRRQLDAGAWAITAATVAQARLMRSFGIERVLLANQVVDPAGVAWLGRELARDAGAWIACLVDSVAGVEALSRHGGSRPVPVLVELGVPGGRTGCRSMDEARAVADAVTASPALVLAGVEAFEGVLHEAEDQARVDSFLADVRALAEGMAADGCFSDVDEVVVSAGGSVWFDRVVEVMRGLDLGLDKPARVVLRSGCYLTHDDGVYDRLSPFGRARRVATERFVPAIEVWAAVLSRPEPDLVLVGMGKRDTAHDSDLPSPEQVVHAGAMRPAFGMSVFDLNDQHAFVRVPPSDPVSPGDFMSFGISHPCTAFDKWRVIPVVDDERTVIGAVRTYF
ncbi:MAG: hypothetical protein QOI20_2079 [Acidimicrobiaceae bacterium]|nr:hypothetical protein [Acidimicrobiaceae bacterium]